MSELDHRVLLAFSRLEPSGLEALAEAGVDVLRETTSSDIIAAVERESLDLCVVFGDGKEALGLLKDIRGSARGAVIPLVLVGEGSGRLTGDEEAQEHGADAYVIDGGDEVALLDRIFTLLGLHSTASIPPSPKVERVSEVPADPIANALAMARMLAADQADLPDTEQFASRGVMSGNLSSVVSEAEKKVAPMFSSEEREGSDISEGLDTVEVEAYLDRPVELEDKLSMPPSDLARPEESPDLKEDGDENGDLATTRIWDIIAGIISRRESGTLVVTSKGVERRISADDGELTMATSSARDDRLIELLHREGRLSDRQYEQAAMTIGASGRRAGAVLVEKGLIASRELFPLVRHHYEALIFDSFSWVEGTWKFRRGRQKISERILLDLPSASIVVEGMRSRASFSDIARIVPPGSKPERAEGGICSLQETGLSDRELQILDWCDGTRATGSIAQRFELSEQELCAILSGLSVLGWLEADRALGDLPAWEPASPHGSTDRSGDHDLRVERARVADKHAQVLEGTYFAIIEVPPEASGYEIRKSYRRLRGLFAPERFAVEELADLRSQAEVIRIVLDEAYEVLRDSSLREGYRAAQADG